MQVDEGEPADVFPEIIIDEVEPSISLLNIWGLGELKPFFINKGIDLEVLKSITADDINHLIPVEHFGLRVKFRTKLFEWRQLNELAIECSTKTITPTVQSAFESPSSTILKWLTDNENNCTSVARTHNLELKTLLSEQILGKKILHDYNENNEHLTKSNRQELVKIIVDFWINSGILVREEHYDNATRQIITLFPSEEEEIYRGSKSKRGKLAEKYYASCKKYREKGLIKSRYNLKRKLPDVKDTTDAVSHISSSATSVTDSSEHDVPQMQKIKTWLKNNFSPQTLVEIKWKSTFHLRREDVLDLSVNIYNEWPILKQRIGSSLIELDFDYLYPGKRVLIFEKWEKFTTDIEKIFRRETKDPKGKALLGKLNENCTEDYKNYILLSLLHTFLIPQIKKLKPVKKKNQYWKPTICEAQESFCTIVSDSTQISGICKKRKELCQQRATKLQPFMIVVGKDVNLTEFYTYFNDTLYDATSFLKALSVTFQLHQVMNVDYCTECLQVWIFIESFFYELPPSSDRSKDLKALLKELNN